MFALIACAALATDPLVQIQLRYPVRRTTITSAAGSIPYYSLPENAPVELRRAYKVLEIAERDVVLTEALQLLKLDYVQNERRLEALRTNALTTMYLNANNQWNTRGPFYLPGQMRQGGLGQHESVLKQGIARNLTREATTEGALLAIDRLAEAQIQLHETWVSLAFPGRKVARAVQGPAGVPAAGVNEAKAAVAGRRLLDPQPAAAEPVEDAVLVKARKAAEDAAREDQEARKRAQVAYAEQVQAARLYQYASPVWRLDAKRAWERASENYRQVWQEWDAAHKQSKAATDRVTELVARARTAPPAGSEPQPRGAFVSRGTASAPAGRP